MIKGGFFTLQYYLYCTAMQTIDSLYIYYKISWFFFGASWLGFAANKKFRENAKILFVFHKFRIFRENEWRK